MSYAHELHIPIFESFTEEYLLITQGERARALAVVAQVDAEGPVIAFHELMRENGDNFTREHSDRVALAAAVVGERLHLDSEDLLLLTESAAVHDVGKQHHDVQSQIHSPIRYEHGTEARDRFMGIVRRHPTISSLMILNSAWSFNKRQQVAEVAAGHHLYTLHEPYGQVPCPDVARLSEILAAVDMLDSLASARPYKDAFGRYDCRRLLEEQFSGDRAILDACFQSTAENVMPAQPVLYVVSGTQQPFRQRR